MRRTTEPSPDSPNQSETPNSPEQYLQPTLPAHPESSAQPKPKAAPLDSPTEPLRPHQETGTTSITSAAASPTSATPLNARGQLTLLTAQVSDALASSIQAIAMPLLTYGATGDLAHSAIVMVIEAIPVILFAPFAGTIADKFNRKTLTVSFSLAQTLGPTIAAAVASFTTPALAVGFAGTLNLLAALTVATIRNYDLTHAERTATVQEHHTGRLLREGAAYTAHNPVVRGMLTFWFLSIAAVPITTLPMLEYLTHGLGHDYTAFGIATSVYAAGCVISSWLSAKLGVGTGTGRVRITKRGWMCISGLGYGAVCLSMGLHPALWAVLVLWFIWGMFYGPEEVLGQVLFADAIDEHMRGRVYSFMGVVFSLAGMIGYLITGWTVPLIGAINTIVAGGSLFVIATVFTFILGPTARAIRVQETRDETKGRAGA